MKPYDLIIIHTDALKHPHAQRKYHILHMQMPYKDEGGGRTTSTVSSQPEKKLNTAHDCPCSIRPDLVQTRLPCGKTIGSGGLSDGHQSSHRASASLIIPRVPAHHTSYCLPVFFENGRPLAGRLASASCAPAAECQEVITGC